MIRKKSSILPEKKYAPQAGGVNPEHSIPAWPPVPAGA
jgi:hypothetical protein